jgi:hypothetical protein
LRRRLAGGGPFRCRYATPRRPTPSPGTRAALAATLVAAAAAGCGADRGDDATPPATPSPATRPPAAVTPPAAALRATNLRAAEALVGLDARRLGLRISVRRPRRGVAAQLDRARSVVTLFASGSEAPHLLAHDLAHELGHAVDLAGLSAADRRTYLARRGRPDAAWWPAAGIASDYAAGAGDFAEVFALCHAASPVFRSRLAPRPVDPCALLPAAASSYAARASKDTW